MVSPARSGAGARGAGGAGGERKQGPRPIDAPSGPIDRAFWYIHEAWPLMLTRYSGITRMFSPVSSPVSGRSVPAACRAPSPGRAAA